MNTRFFPSKSLAIALVVSAGAFMAAPASADSTSDSTDLGETTLSQVLQLAQETGTIVDVASGNDDFDTLVQAVQTADLVDTLSSEGPFTVFAPTDEAFDDLPDGALEALLEPENRDLLTDILTYHVVPGEVMSTDLETGVVDTLNGGLAVRVEPDQVIVNDASVVAADVPASNGVIHAVNRVLIPTSTRAELLRRLQATETETQTGTVEAIPALW